MDRSAAAAAQFEDAPRPMAIDGRYHDSRHGLRTTDGCGGERSRTGGGILKPRLLPARNRPVAARSRLVNRKFDSGAPYTIGDEARALPMHVRN